MKLIFTLITVVMTAGIFLILSCNEKSQKSNMAISVLKDKTEKLSLQVEKDRIYQMFHLDPKSKTELEQGVLLRVGEIGSVDFGKTEDISIGYIPLGESNMKARQKEIAQFYKKADQAFSMLDGESKLGSSSIFIPVSREVIRLSKQSANQKKLILYSDLIEHSDWINMYKEYRSPTETIVAKYKKQLTLPDLTGVEIILRYIPPDSETNRIYRKMIEVYTQIFEEKGATVSFEF